MTTEVSAQTVRNGFEALPDVRKRWFLIRVQPLLPAPAKERPALNCRPVMNGLTRVSRRSGPELPEILGALLLHGNHYFSLGSRTHCSNPSLRCSMVTSLVLVSALGTALYPVTQQLER